MNRYYIAFSCFSSILALSACFDSRGGRSPGPSGDSGVTNPPGDSGIVVCGDDRCAETETCSSCPADCGPCSATCGDELCSGSETCSSCPADCGPCSATCGDELCSGSETCSSCPADCGPCGPSCGDGLCNGSETCSSCPADCGPCGPSCGDGLCNGFETCSTCETDCGPCGPTCPDNFLPPYAGAGCSSSTATCTSGCSTSECIQGCLEADPNPECLLCVDQNILSCANSAGCQEEWNCYIDCATTAGCTSLASCPACRAEEAAYLDCADLVVDSCSTVWFDCLPLEGVAQRRACSPAPAPRRSARRAIRARAPCRRHRKRGRAALGDLRARR
ncbi:MAG TPA: hypothetical protein VIL20_14195 [Sandaracinaceae bacterium]